MKKKSTFNFAYILSVILFLSHVDNSFAQIANSYPNDSNIQTDPSVVFTEMGEESSLSNLLSNWSGNSTSGCTSVASLALDSTSIPAGSLGNQSIRLFTTAGSPGPGVCRTSYLRKTFPAFSGDTIYARWYVKYNTVGTFHHSGTRLGGSNPISATTLNVAGILPSGSDFFYVGAETYQGKNVPVTQSTFDFFNYWMHQRHNSIFPATTYYGNSFINDTNVFINMSVWNCIEIRLIMNNPVTSYNGEIAMWINGIQVSDVKTGTLGNWNEDRFTPNIGGSAFEGFQFRDTSSLTFNYFELMHYVDNDSIGFVNSVNYDHIVLAKKYIGPIYTNALGIENLDDTSSLLIYPNPANDIVKFSKPIKDIKVYNVYGQQVISISEKTDNISTKELADGIYLIQMGGTIHKIIVNH